MTASTGREALLVELARLAREAGKIVLDVYATDFAVEDKGRNDPVTVADKRANAFLVAELQRLFPGVPIVAEESDASGYAGFGAASAAFFVDPLDGTREFVARNGEFVVMIGLAEDGRAVAGAVHQPTEGRTWTGAEGVGAFEIVGGAERRLAVSDVPLAASRVVVSRSRRTPRLDAMLAATPPRDVRQMGSAGLKAVTVARGDADLYVQLGRAGSLWDACAPEAILRAAGAEVTHEDGSAIDYRSADVVVHRGFLAAAPNLHADVLARLRALSRPFLAGDAVALSAFALRRATGRSGGAEDQGFVGVGRVRKFPFLRSSAPPCSFSKRERRQHADVTAWNWR